jgi:hypothetical protein
MKERVALLLAVSNILSMFAVQVASALSIYKKVAGEGPTTSGPSPSHGGGGGSGSGGSGGGSRYALPAGRAHERREGPPAADDVPPPPPSTPRTTAGLQLPRFSLQRAME